MRRYQLRARAERQQQTRERIVAVTAALHEELGPARTTIAEIARRAGVQRLTVYNHFPELRDLLAACQGHFLAGHPPPDVAPTGDPEHALDRFEKAATELYGWYRANAAMQRNVHRDRQLVPELDDLMRKNSDPPFAAAAAQYAEALAGTPAARAPVRHLVRLAFQFQTWELLSREANDREIARLFRQAVAGVLAAPRSEPRSARVL